ncbi:hypothetical protein HPB51_001029 [Rhipicephalus microplus]|uniref:Uncharacterized protein n=1 Tax=Rhipicephalus microplus TaxID=6941 RepID=A0A9J6DE30_RHIMP|nr:hypothetical protein HPB51_001029 [Rhipicephalus microplus]
MSARIRVRKEQNIALVSTSDPDLAVQLCHVQTLKLGSRSYEVSAYVASPDNSCKGVITGALPIPTEDAPINDTVTYPQSMNIIQARPFGTNGACLHTFEEKRVPRYVYFQGVEFRCRPFRPITQVCHCCLRTGHRQDICPFSQERRCGNCGILNPSEHHDGCVPQCLTCGSDEHPTIDLGCPTRQRRPGPRVLRDERPLLEKPNDPPLKQLCEQLPTNNQPRSGPQHASSEGHGRSVRSKRSKTPKHGNQTSQPIQPGAPPPIQASAHSSRNYPPPSSQCSAKSYNTWPALPQREPTHAPGLEDRGGALSSSGLAAGGRLVQAPQSQLQRRQDPLAVPGNHLSVQWPLFATYLYETDIYPIFKKASWQKPLLLRLKSITQIAGRFDNARPLICRHLAKELPRRSIQDRPEFAKLRIIPSSGDTPYERANSTKKSNPPLSVLRFIGYNETIHRVKDC